MEDQKPKCGISWLAILNTIFSIVIIYMIIAVEQKIDDVRVAALRAESAASNASEQAYTAASNASEAKDSADQAVQYANEAADYSSNCPGN